MEIRYFKTIMPEDIGPHDYIIHSQKGDAVVKAYELTSNLNAEIVAFVIGNNAYRKEIYLVGKDDRLYYHMYNDEILNQHIPYQECLEYLGSCESSGILGTARQRRPDLWYFNECYPSGVFVVVHVTLQKQYRDAWIGYRRQNEPRFLFYYASEEFPLFVHSALENKYFRTIPVV